MRRWKRNRRISLATLGGWRVPRGRVDLIQLMLPKHRVSWSVEDAKEILKYHDKQHWPIGSRTLVNFANPPGLNGSLTVLYCQKSAQVYEVNPFSLLTVPVSLGRFLCVTTSARTNELAGMKVLFFPLSWYFSMVWVTPFSMNSYENTYSGRRFRVAFIFRPLHAKANLKSALPPRDSLQLSWSQLKADESEKKEKKGLARSDTENDWNGHSFHDIKRGTFAMTYPTFACPPSSPSWACNFCLTELKEVFLSCRLSGGATTSHTTLSGTSQASLLSPK